MENVSLKILEHSSELKNLFLAQSFANNQLPKKIKFKLDDCASMSFDINIGENIYQGGLNNNGELFYDKTILDKYVNVDFKTIFNVFIRNCEINPNIELTDKLLTFFNNNADWFY